MLQSFMAETSCAWRMRVHGHSRACFQMLSAAQCRDIWILSAVNGPKASHPSALREATTGPKLLQALLSDMGNAGLNGCPAAGEHRHTQSMGHHRRRQPLSLPAAGTPGTHAELSPLLAGDSLPEGVTRAGQDSAPTVSPAAAVSGRCPQREPGPFPALPAAGAQPGTRPPPPPLPLSGGQLPPAPPPVRWECGSSAPAGSPGVPSAERG